MVKCAYKMTELGPIPVDWKAKRFDECFMLMRNNTYARECLTDHYGSVANVHYGDILVKYGAVLDFVKDSITYLKPGVKPNKDLLKDGDIIFADTAEDETTGKAVEVQGIGDGKAVAGLHTVACRPHDGIFAPRYLGYYINSAAYHNQLLPLMTGTKVTSISRAGFVSTHVAIPPKSAQEKIAEALSDVDGLLAAMTKLIEKKHAIKQGAMQQLLTGKKRLAGFTGKWVEKRIGDMAEVATGATPSTLCPEFWGGDIRWMSSGELNDKIVSEVVGRITKAGFDACSTHMVPVGCVLIGLAGQGKTRGTAAYNLVELCTNQSIAAILPNASFDSRFLYYYMDQQYEELRLLSAGDGGRGGLTKGQIENFFVTIPPTNVEQHAISIVLSDMDTEIMALEAKRSKFEQIKQGMMQELLTGNTRFS